MSPKDPDVPTLDPGQLAELRSNCGHDPAVVAEVLELYLREGEQTLPMLRQAATAQELEALGALAHKFRGGSSYVGACRMTDLCEMLEELSKAGTSDGAIDLIDQMVREFVALTDAIRLELASATS